MLGKGVKNCMNRICSDLYSSGPVIKLASLVAKKYTWRDRGGDNDTSTCWQHIHQTFNIIILPHLLMGHVVCNCLFLFSMRSTIYLQTNNSPYIFPSADTKLRGSLYWKLWMTSGPFLQEAEGAQDYWDTSACQNTGSIAIKWQAPPDMIVKDWHLVPSLVA